MKSIALSAFLILAFLVSSCKKNNDQTGISSSLIKRITFTDTTEQYLIGSVSFQYDAEGNILQMTLAQWMGEIPQYYDSLVHTFEYHPSMLIEKIFYHNDRYGRNVYNINPEGLAISETDMGYSPGGDSSIAQTATYKYNSSGYLIEKMTYVFGDTSGWTSWTWQIINGNIASLVRSLSWWWGGGSVTESYEYYPYTINTLGNSHMGKFFLGKSNTNLIKSSMTNSPTPTTAAYTYTFDSGKRVIKEFIRGSSLTDYSVNAVITYY